jgi:hypothetical protein
VQDSETVTYGAVSNVTSGLDLVTNGLADFLVTDGALSSAQLGAGKLRVPLIGSAIVAAYHLPSLTATDPPLVRLACPLSTPTVMTHCTPNEKSPRDEFRVVDRS